MARWPAAGRCKSRLSNQIGRLPASVIQNEVTKHTIAVVRRINQRDLINARIAISGLGPKACQRWSRTLEGFQIHQQGEGSLGLRMRRQIIFCQREKKITSHTGRTTLIIGADLPSLCEQDILKAIELLESHQMVIGPAKDGGYWLIGLSGSLLNPVPQWPFCGIPWGTNHVLSETLRKAESLKINYQLLQEQSDLDLIEDLEPWLQSNQRKD